MQIKNYKIWVLIRYIPIKIKFIKLLYELLESELLGLNNTQNTWTKESYEIEL